MSDEKSKSLDVLGIKPIGDSIQTIVKGTMDGAGAFLGRICLPAAEEFGLLLKDKVSKWRAENAVSIVAKAERKLNDREKYTNLHAHPRLITTAFENGSWAEDDFIQEMWAGLLSSSCDETGKDESNLLFMQILSQLNSTETAILNYICETAEKIVSEAGWIYSNEIDLELIILQKISGVGDVHRLDRELDHLRSLDLIEGGFSHKSTNANVNPTPLALHMYVRCQGYIGSPTDYFGIKYEEQPSKLRKTLNKLF